MFFTKVGRAVAWLAVIMGALRIFAAIVVANSADPSMTAQRYLNGDSSGAAIDGAIVVIVVGIALGILTEISRTLAASKA